MLRLVWDTYESEVLHVDGVPEDWDGPEVHATVWGLNDEPTPLTLTGEPKRDGEKFYPVRVQGEAISSGFGFLARKTEELPPSEREGDERALFFLRRFIEQHGHADVPVEHVIDGFALGRWVQNTRKSRGLPASLVERLDLIPEWKWDC